MTKQTTLSWFLIKLSVVFYGQMTYCSYRLILNTVMQHQLDALATYCKANKLSVNKLKTKVMYKYVGAWLDSKGSCDTCRHGGGL